MDPFNSPRLGSTIFVCGFLDEPRSFFGRTQFPQFASIAVETEDEYSSGFWCFSVTLTRRSTEAVRGFGNKWTNGLGRVVAKLAATERRGTSAGNCCQGPGAVSVHQAVIRILHVDLCASWT